MIENVFNLAVFILVLSILVVVHEFGHFIAAKKSGVKVEVFSLGFGKKIFSRKRKDTEYCISAIPLGGYVKMAGDTFEDSKGGGDEYMSQPLLKRLAIVFCGPLLNYLLGFVLFWLIFFAGYPALTTKVGGLVEGMGAEAAGIVAGDRIISVQGIKVKTWEELQQAIQNRKDADALSIEIERGGQNMALAVSIRQAPLLDALGQKKNMGLIGIKPDVSETVIMRHGFLQSAGLGLRKTAELTAMTYKALWLMITGKMSARDSVTGPLGIFVVTSAAAKLGITALLHLIAALSISLGIFNLLPLPALDGGHLALMAVEKLRGRGLSKKSEDIFVRIGFGFLITIAALVFLNDLVKFGFIDKITKLFGK
jgi:regulator of sigma E protease